MRKGGRMFTKKTRKIIAIIIAGVTALTTTFTSYAKDFSFTRSGSAGSSIILNNREYTVDGTTGIYAFSLLKASDLNTPRVINAYTGTAIPGSGSYSRGANAQTSALRYNSTDVKKGMYDSQSRTWLQPPLSDGKYYLSFRFAGVGITGINSAGAGTAQLITNPNFVSDSISERSSAENPPETAHQATVYKYEDGSNGYPAEFPTVYGYGGGFHTIDPDSGSGLAFYSTGVSYDGKPAWPGTISQLGAEGSSAVPTRNYSEELRKSSFNSDPGMAQAAFNNWKTTDAGEWYWAQASAYLATHGDKLAQYGIDTEWKLLNALFKISGDPTASEVSTIYFCSFMVKGTTKQYYNTYSYTPGISKNMAPTYLGVVNVNTGLPVAQATREQSQADLTNGAKQVKFANTVDLARGHDALLNVNMSFFAKDQGVSTVNANRTVSVGLMDGDTWKAMKLSYSRPKASVNLDASIRAEGQSSDGKDSGSITASQSGASYYQGAKFETRLTIPEDAPNTGKIRVAVADPYTLAGDNGLPADDILEIPYTTDGTSGTSGGGTSPLTPHYDPDNKGDMNIGLPQYRSLHYVAWEEEEADPTAEPEIDPATGLPVPPKMILVERYSDYGAHSTPDLSICSEENVIGEEDPGDWGTGKHDVLIRSLADGESIVAVWWHYDSNQRFPSDIDDKIWAEKTTTRGTYTRSETATHTFDIGTRISRSRGQSSNIDDPMAKIKVYGLYPDDNLNTIEDDITNRIGSTNSDGTISVKGVSGLSVYDSVSAYLKNVTVGSNLEIYYPRLKIVSEVNAPSSAGGSGVHGESGLFTDYEAAPYQNSWDTASDHAERTLLAESDDMIIMETEVTDSEGYIIYHADRYANEGGSMSKIMNGSAFDREEDMKLRVVVKQNESASHIVKDPAIDVTVSQKGKNDAITRYCIPGVEYVSSWKSNDELYATYEIYFRPTNCAKLDFDIKIAEKHGSAYWRENKWDEERDQHRFNILCTTADMEVTQDIELYNSVGAQQSFLTFAEYLKFKYDVRHTGKTETQRAVIGNTAINPLPTLDVKLYNADKLTTNAANKLVHTMATQDPKASAAYLEGGSVTSKTRLFPGLGQSGYASHVQVWYEGANGGGFIVPTWTTATGNKAAVGHIVATGRINSLHDQNWTNVREDVVDYVQKEFKGEKDIGILDIVATNRNPISEKTGISVQVAIENMPSSFNDQTVVDHVYLDIYVDDDLMETAQVDIPVGDTVVTEVIIPDVGDRLETGSAVVEARVNVEEHQTHYEYVLKETNPSLHEDPFANNYAETVVTVNEPSKEICPGCVIDPDNDSASKYIWKQGLDDVATTAAKIKKIE